MSLSSLFRRLMTQRLRSHKAAPVRKTARPLGRRIKELEDRTVPATYNWNGSNALTVSLGTGESLSVVNTGSTNPAYQFTLSGGADVWTADGTTADGGTTGGGVTLNFDANADLANSIAIDNTGASAGTNNVAFASGTITSATITVSTTTGSGTGSITESGGILSTAGTLTTSSATGTTLGGANTVGTFNATNTTSGNISLTNAAALSVTGIDQAGSGNVGVSTTGSNTALTVNGLVVGSGGSVTLEATGNLTVAASQTVNSGAGTLTLFADSNAVGVGTLSIDAGATVTSSNASANAITLRGAVVHVDTSSNPAVVGATRSLGTTPSVTYSTGVADPYALAFDSSGNLYVANEGSNTVSEFAAGTTTLKATYSTGLDPYALALDSSGNLYVANFGSGTVSEFAAGTTTLKATYSTGGSPSALAFDSSGNLYVANFGSGTVSEFTAGTTTLKATYATGVSSPSALAFDSSGNLYVANNDSSTVSEFTAGTTTLKATYSAGVKGPFALAFDSSGNLYVANGGNGTVSEFTAGTTTLKATYSTRVSSPFALAFDSSGNLYVANNDIGTVSEFTAGTTTLKATYSTGFGPIALAFDSSGNLYVANYNSSTVSEFTSTPPTPTAGGVAIQSSLESRPMLIGGTNSNPVAGINLTSAELAQIFTTSTGTIAIGDPNQTGNITLATATPATTASASTVVVQSTSGTGQIILDDGGTATTALSGNGGTLALTAGTGGIVEAGDDLTGTADLGNATAVSLTSAGAIGTSSNPVQLAATDLTTTTSANNSNQFLSALTSVTAIGLSAGSGTITLASGTFTAGNATAFSGDNVTDNSTLNLTGFSSSIGALNGSGTVTNNYPPSYQIDNGSVSTGFNNTLNSENEDNWVANVFTATAGDTSLGSISFQAEFSDLNAGDLPSPFIQSALYVGAPGAGLTLVPGSVNTVPLNSTAGQLVTVPFATAQTVTPGEVFTAALLIDDVPSSVFPFTEDTSGSSTNSYFDDDANAPNGTVDTYNLAAPNDPTLNGDNWGTSGFTNASVGITLLRVNQIGSASTATLTVNGGGSFSGILQDGSGGALALTVGGSSQTLTLTGTNTYSGPTTIDSTDTLQIGNGGTTGTLGTGAVTDNGNLVFDESNNLFVGNAIGGTGSLTQSGTAAVILTNTNSYGTTTIDGGATLQIGSGGATGSLGTGGVTDNGSLAYDLTGTTTTSNAISGTGSLTQGGPSGSTVILTGSNSYGATTIDSGTTLQIGNGGASGSVGTGPVTDNGSLVFDLTSNPTVASAIGGIGSLTQSGSGTLTLSNFSNTYTGATTISAGTLAVNGSITSSVTNSGTLQGSGTITGNVSGSGTFSPGNNPTPGIMTIDGNFTPSGTVTFKVNAPYATAGTDYDQYVIGGTVNLSGSTLTLTNNLAGTFPTLPAQVILISHAGGLTTGGSPADGSSLSLGTNTVKLFYNGGDGNDVTLVNATAPTVAYVSPTFAGNTNGTLIPDADFGTSGNQPAIFGVNAFTTIGAALGAITNSGQVIVNSGTYPEAVSLTGTQTLTITGVNVAGAVTIDPLTTTSGTTVQIQGSSSLTDDDATSTTAAGTITGGGSLTKTGAGTLTLSGTNTYGGTTTVSGGTLADGVANALPTDTALTVTSPGTFDLAGFNQQVGNLNGTGIVASSVSGSTLTVTGTGTLSGTMIGGSNLALTIDGGTLTLGGGSGDTSANTYTGTTLIENGGTLDLNKAGGTNAIAGNATIGNANSTNSLVLDNNSQIATTSVLSFNSGGGGNSGKLDLNGYDQTVAGIQTLSADGSASVIQNFEDGTPAGPDNPAVLTVNDTASYLYDGIIRDNYDGSGTLALVKQGTGTLTLADGYSATATNYTGSTTIGGGTLVLSNLGEFDSSISDTAALRIAQTSNNLTLSTGVSGTGGTLTKIGTGTLTLTGTNSYTGATTVCAGTLLVNGNDSAATGAVAVNNSGTLGGTGTIGGAVTVNSGGFISPGTVGTVGTLTVGGLDFNGGTYLADFRGNCSDTIATAGTIDLADPTQGIFTVNSQTGSTSQFNVYTLIGNTGTGAIANPPLSGAPVNGNVTIDGTLTVASYVGANGKSFTLTQVVPPTIAVAFNPATIPLNGTSSLTFTITNPNPGTALTGVGFTDTLPAGLTVPNGTITNVGGSGGTVTVTNTTTITLSSAGIAANGTLSFSVTVTGATGGFYTDTTGTVSSTNGGIGNTASATLTVDNVGLVVSAGANVEIFSPSNHLLKTLTPFTGVSSVQVARGDLNGDEDIIVASGPGGGEVKVYDGITFQQVDSFYPYGTSYTAGLYIAIGNVLDTNVQHQDVVVGPGGTPQSEPVKIFNAGGTLLTSFAPTTLFPASEYVGGVHVAAGNLNGAGQAEVIVGLNLPQTGYAQVWTYNGTKMVAAGQNYSFLGKGTTLATESVGGHSDLVVGIGGLTAGDPAQLEVIDGISGHVVASLPTSSLPVFSNGSSQEAEVAVADVNGDGTLDIVVATGAGVTQQVRVFDLSGSSLILEETFTASQLGLATGYSLGLDVG